MLLYKSNANKLQPTIVKPLVLVHLQSLPPPKKKISWFYSISNLQSQTQPKCKEEVQRSQGPGVQRSINKNKNKIRALLQRRYFSLQLCYKSNTESYNNKFRNRMFRNKSFFFKSKALSMHVHGITVSWVLSFEK